MDPHPTTRVERSFAAQDLDCDFSKFAWGSPSWRAKWIRAAVYNIIIFFIFFVFTCVDYSRYLIIIEIFE